MKNLILVLGFLFLNAACVPVLAPHKESTPVIAPADLQPSWWQVRYQLDWPEGGAPSWWLDGLIANEVFDQAMRTSQKEPALWRFHRRAKRDNTGFQFSFLFYASAEEAAHVYEAVSANSTAKELLRRKIIRKIVVDSPLATKASGVSKTSDPGWDPKLQEAWPEFAMGVSKTWLSLTRSCLESHERQDFDMMLEAYKESAACVTAIWRKQGQHAFLHHLQALMGYESLPIGTEMRF